MTVNCQLHDQDPSSLGTAAWVTRTAWTRSKEQMCASDGNRLSIMKSVSNHRTYYTLVSYHGSQTKSNRTDVKKILRRNFAWFLVYPFQTIFSAHHRLIQFTILTAASDLPVHIVKFLARNVLSCSLFSLFLNSNTCHIYIHLNICKVCFFLKLNGHAKVVLIIIVLHIRIFINNSIMFAFLIWVFAKSKEPVTGKQWEKYKALIKYTY
jgi:hypothetical protein